MKQTSPVAKATRKLSALAGLCAIGYVAAIATVQGPIATYRILTNLWPSIHTYRIFPQRTIETARPASEFKKEHGKKERGVRIPDSITFASFGRSTTIQLRDLLTQTDTKAFIVIRNDAVIYEAYPNGGSRNSFNSSFSVVKSFMSTLIGIAIAEGKIKSLDDRVIQYLPELKDRGLDPLTIRDLLRMSSGIPFAENGGMFPLAVPFSDDPRIQYSPNLREIALSVKAGDEAIGKYFRYNDYHLLLEGLILERVTGGTVSQYLQEKIWKPMRMEYPASWSLDSESDGFEKTEAGLNARAIDFARFGLLFIHQGKWNGRQIVSPQWVREATTPDPGDRRPWKVATFWPQVGGYYKFHWWGLNNPDGSYDYMARGYLGQIIYVSPSNNTVVVRFGGGPRPDGVWPFAIRELIRQLSAT
jgi:CubicO group peptidase (beta-lactamase class C family)